MSRSHDPYAAFRIRDYRLYVIGWVVARMGTHIQSIAIAWEIYQRTGEALSLGLVGLAQALPLMVLALPAGLLADRYERRRLSIISLLGMTVTSLALAAFSLTEGPVSWMYALLFLDACAMTVGRPARTALLPQLVPAEVFPNAVTWNTSLMHIASVVGPALGGFVIAVSVSSAYFVAAAGSLWLAFILTRIQFRPVEERPEPANWQTLVAGIRFVWDKRILFTLMALDLVRGAAGRGGLSAADLCGGHIVGGSDGVRVPACGACGRRVLHGSVDDLSTADEAGGTLAAAGGGRFWRGDDHFRLLAEFRPIVGDALFHGRAGQHQYGGAADVDPVADAGPDAGSGFGGERHLHRCVERAGRFRVGDGGALARAGHFGGEWGIGTILVVTGAAALSPQLLRLGALHEAQAEKEA